MKLLSPVIFILVTTFSFGQLSKSDEQFLTAELLKKVNALRAEKGLGALLPDAELAEAAKAHSDYMAKDGILSHDEKPIATSDPQKRVRKAGGKEFETVGENILYTVPQYFPLKTKELSALSETMFQQWKNSPKHYANMIHSEYTFSGFGFSVEPKTKSVFATQVFGRKGIVIAGQLSTNAFGVLEKTKECRGLLDNNENSVANLGDAIYIEGNQVMLSYHDISTVRDIIKNANDGVAVDLVADYQVECGAPNQLDVSPIYDGIMLAPVYRDQLFAGNQAQSDFRLITPIGQIPASYPSENVSLSLILIKNGIECSYKIPSDIPYKPYNLSDINPVLNDPKNVQMSTRGIIRSEEVIFDFKTNVTSGKANILPKASNERIHSIDITSFSSVDGVTENNIRLQNSRGAFIRKKLHEHLQFPDSSVTVNAQENWPKMLFQLNYFDLSDLAAQSHDSVKAFVRANKSDVWDSLLAVQRQSFAAIHYEGTLQTGYTAGEYVFLNLRTAILEKNDQLANKALYELYNQENEMSDISGLFEQRIFQELLNNTALVQNASAVLSLQPKLYLYQITEFIAAWIYRMNELPSEAHYNLLHLYTLTSSAFLDEWDVPSQRLAKVIHPSRLVSMVNTLNKNELSLNFHLSAINYYGQINDSKNIHQSFDFIAGHFKKSTLTPEEENALVLFYNNWSRYDLTIAQLMPHLNEPGFNTESAFILLKTAMGYQDGISEAELEKSSYRAKELDQELWCSWVKSNYQLKRYPFIKTAFCSSCLEGY